MKKPLTIIFLLFAVATYSQQCNCDSNFIWLKAYLERNYPGFKPKVTPATQSEYDANNKKYETLIKQSTKNAYCEYYLHKWARFYKDDHIQIGGKKSREYDKKDEADTTYIHELNRNTEVLNIDSAAFVKQLGKTKERTIEGIYRTFDSTYVVVLVKNKNSFRDYAGVIMSSKTKLWHGGQVKLELKQVSDSSFDVISYQRNHAFAIYGQSYVLPKKGEVSFYGWQRIFPGEEHDKVKNDEVQDNSRNTEYKNINEQISYIKIESFEDRYRREIDSTLKTNTNNIKSHRYMIIDLRDNGGGSDGSFQSLLPIVYSNPIVDIGVDIYSTPDNIKAIEKMVKQDKYMQEDEKHYYDSVNKVLAAHPYQFVSQGPDDTATFDSVWHYPEKVAILINHGCGSTTEQFLLFAKQCKKVTLMGQNSDGVLDYSNDRPVDFPNLPATLYYPVTLSRRIAMHQGIDGIGITPKIKLDLNCDWIMQATMFLPKL